MSLRRFIEDIVCNRFGGFLAFGPPPLYASILFDPLAKGGFNAGVLNGYLRCIALAPGLIDHVTRGPARRMPFDKLSVFLEPYPVDSLGAPALALGGLMGVSLLIANQILFVNRQRLEQNAALCLKMLSISAGLVVLNTMCSRLSMGVKYKRVANS